MKTFPYQTIRELHEARERERRRDKRIGAIVGLTLLGLGVVLNAWLWVDGHRKKEAVLIEGVRGSIAGRGDNSLWESWYDAAHTAGELWRKEGVYVPDISMKADPGACDSKGIAAADPVKHIVYVCKDGSGLDRTTIMMHEIGHVLGVPHIEDDPLMAPAYQEPLNAPSEAALAIARTKAGAILTTHLPWPSK